MSDFTTTSARGLAGLHQYRNASRRPRSRPSSIASNDNHTIGSIASLGSDASDDYTQRTTSSQASSISQRTTSSQGSNNCLRVVSDIDPAFITAESTRLSDVLSTPPAPG